MSATSRVADVVTLPVRVASQQTSSLASSAAGHLRVWTANEVDDWGRDNGFVDRIWSFSQQRWHISVGGADHVPRRAGALVVVNARRFALAPVFAALAIGGAVDRPVRFVGRPDTAPVGPTMQRLGGLLPLAGEIEGALAAGQVVVLGAAHRGDNARAGRIDHHLVGAAVASGVKVLPAATVSTPLGRRARVEIGSPVKLARKRRGPLAELELADELQVRIDVLLEQIGGAPTGTPLDWFPFGAGGV